MTYNGKEVADDAEFTVVVNNYRYNGGGNYVAYLNENGCDFVANDPDRIIYSTQYDMIQGEDNGQARNMLANYIREKGTIEPEVTSDWMVVYGYEPPYQLPFTDVEEGRYYYDAVVWAAQSGIAAGVTDSTFEPNTACNRAQIVSFIWRFAGSPVMEGLENPFVDVEEGRYYYDAVLICHSAGVVAGVSENAFAPNKTCTRAEAVTFLWRLNGEPEATIENPFTDLDEDAYYYEAVLWAVENGITAGMTETTFAPHMTCTRGHIVSFLYRMANAQ
jgi:hypothetical protein